jgi:hypothetical protein
MQKSDKELLNQRDKAIRREIDKLMKCRLKNVVNGGSIPDMKQAIYEEVAARYKLKPDYVKQIKWDKNIRKRSRKHYYAMKTRKEA